MANSRVGKLRETADRERRDARKKPGPGLPCFYVLTEGSVTEQSYLNGIHERRTKFFVLNVKRAGVPITCVELAVELKRRIEDDDVLWCAFDKDDHDIAAAVHLAVEHGIDVAISNPCIEIWLLQHWRGGFTRPCHRDDVIAEWCKRIGSETKSVDFDAYPFEEHVERAIESARRMIELSKVTDPEHPHEKAPFTAMGTLVEELLQLSATNDDHIPGRATRVKPPRSETK